MWQAQISFDLQRGAPQIQMIGTFINGAFSPGI